MNEKEKLNLIPDTEIEKQAEIITTGSGVGQYMDKPPRVANFILGAHFALSETEDFTEKFADWLRTNNMSPNGFGGWGAGNINTNYYGSSTNDLIKVYKPIYLKEKLKK